MSYDGKLISQHSGEIWAAKDLSGCDIVNSEVVIEAIHPLVTALQLCTLTVYCRYRY